MYPLATDEDLLVLLGAVRALAHELAFEPRALLELDLAVREVGSNALRHGGGGRATVRAVTPDDGGAGIEVAIADDGPGIPDVDAAFVDGYSTRRGLGVGLGAARRLSDRLSITTSVGAGTTVSLLKRASRASRASRPA